MQEHLSQIIICKPGTYICKQADLMNKGRKDRTVGFVSTIKNIYELPVSVPIPAGPSLSKAPFDKLRVTRRDKFRPQKSG